MTFGKHRHRGEQRGLEPQEPAHAGGERGGVRPRLRREREVDLPHGARGGAGAGGTGGGGVIINIGSTAGIRPRPGLTWYNGSKGAVNLMSRSMAVELAPQKIRVNCVAPVMGATGPSGAIHGAAGHAGKPRQVHRKRAAGPPLGTQGHRQCLPLSSPRTKRSS